MPQGSHRVPRLTVVRDHPLPVLRLAPVFTLLLGTACSSQPGAPLAQPQRVNPGRAAVTADAPVVAQAPEADPLPAWKPHKCKKTVWPSYESYSDDEPEVSTYEPDPFDEGGGDAGKTIDQKTRDLAKTRPSEGVCDVRKRTDLEASLARLPAVAPAKAPATAWDRKTAPGYRDLVHSTLALTAEEDRQLARDGFVVPARLGYDDYASAYSDIHRGQLPVFVSVDSILHAVYASHDQLVGSLEKGKLLAHLDAALGAMHCALPLAANDYPADVANDVDLYLTVARTLLASNSQTSCCDEVPSELGKVDAAAQNIVKLILASGPLTEIELFGRKRSFDASQYTPRGHYAGDSDLEQYFHAAMWLSRTELNLVSRDSRSSQPGYQPDPTETPREAVVALALADLAKRSKATAEIAAIDNAWSAFAGRREDIPFAELDKLRAKAGITKLTDPEAAARLRDAIGDSYQRTVNVHPMPNVPHLPAIATMIGPRITPDTVALGALVDGRGPDLQAAEVGFMLGHDRGLAHLKSDPKLVARLRTARDELSRVPAIKDLYGAWLDAIRALAKRPQGALPSFMDGSAFADLRLDSALAAYGQLRHNHVLIAAQVYDQGGCEIPDGYVEPAIETYRALAAYAARGKAVFAALDPKDSTQGVAYFTRLERLMNVLTALSREELANRPLSAEAKRFLSMIVEMREASAWNYNGTFPIATHDGWYLDLFPFQDVAFKDASFIADYATYNRDGEQGIHYLGAKGPSLGVFVVDAGGAPRMMVGPVAHAYQHTGKLEHRLDDDAATSIQGSAPWSASYSVAAPAAPDLTLKFQRDTKPDPDAMRRGAPKREVPPNVVRIESLNELGTVTVDLLDHHFVTLKNVTIRVGKGVTDTVVPALSRPVESIRIRVGAFQARVDLDLSGYLRHEFGASATRPVAPVVTEPDLD